MKLLTHLPSPLKNKYFIATASFAVIMLFLDKSDLFTQGARARELKDLQKSKAHYIKEINELNKIKEDLMHDPKTIERHARENFHMKRDNEDLFIIEENYEQANN